MRGQPGMPPREEQYAQLPGPSLHFHAIEQGFASITPLQIDLTNHEALPRLTQWLAQ